MTDEHLHLNELPKWIIRKGSSNLKYRDEVIHAMNWLKFTHEQVLRSANEAKFLVTEINSGSWLTPEPSEVHEAVRRFAYHYENYCHRAYILREKICLYVNDVFEVGYSTREVNIKNLIIQPKLREYGVHLVFDKFDTSKASTLGKLIKNRTSMTHSSFYTDNDLLFMPAGDVDTPEDFKGWTKSWSRNITLRAKSVDAAQHQMDDINHILSEKALKYHENKRQNRKRSRT